MTANKRLVLNIFATYGRSLYTLVCGLLTSRWVLMSLGDVDFGLYGLVGSLALIVTFLNGTFSFAVGRFYAYAIGEANKSPIREVGLDNCRKWFNTAFLIHTVIPIFLMLVGYPLGVYLVKTYLTIPADRIDACVWVWRFVCISSFVSMINVPFQAMYNAKQEIAELTIYSFLSTTVNVLFLGYMVSHPGVWLVKYAFGVMLISVIPQVIICLMAFRAFPECRIIPRYFIDKRRILSIGKYAGLQTLVAVSRILNSQGVAIVVNKFLGPARNATMSIGNSISGQVTTFSYAITNAFYPALTNAAGEGDLDKMHRMAYRTCMLASAVILIFAVPLCVELDTVLKLWLKVPPVGACGLCLGAIAAVTIPQFTQGCWMSYLAMGKVGWAQISGAVTNCSLFVLAIVFLTIGYDIGCVGVAMTISAFLVSISDLFFARALTNFSVRYWAVKTVCPILISVGVALVFCLIPRAFISSGFVRLCMTTLSYEVVYLPLLWIWMLSKEDRDMLVSKLRKKGC